MSTRISLGAGAKDGRQQVLWKDGERVLYRGLRADRTRAPHSVLALRLIAKSPPPASLDRLAHEYGLKDHLESAWAARPLELLRDRNGTTLVLEHQPPDLERVRRSLDRIIKDGERAREVFGRTL